MNKHLLAMLALCLASCQVTKSRTYTHLVGFEVSTPPRDLAAPADEPQVFVDGVDRGTTIHSRFRMRLEASEHSVRIDGNAYRRTWEGSVVVEAPRLILIPFGQEGRIPLRGPSR